MPGYAYNNSQHQGSLSTGVFHPAKIKVFAAILAPGFERSSWLTPDWIVEVQGLTVIATVARTNLIYLKFQVERGQNVKHLEASDALNKQVKPLKYSRVLSAIF